MLGIITQVHKYMPVHWRAVINGVPYPTGENQQRVVDIKLIDSYNFV